MSETVVALFATLREALRCPTPPPPMTWTNGGTLPSVFAVSDLAQASIGVAGSALASLVALQSGDRSPTVTVDRDGASAWFHSSIRPIGWELESVWDAVAGDYASRDGWIRLHTNAAAHRAAVLAVLDVPEDRAAVSQAVGRWSAEELESAVVAHGGAAAAMRSLAQWREHPQGRSVAREPLVWSQRTSVAVRPEAPFGQEGRPLAGLRVLDLTRVLAGPVATRLLAGWGAQVLRIDPPDWDEPSVVPEVTLGKRCARLDLRSVEAKTVLLELLAGADIVLHGYRPDALEHLGLGDDVRQSVRPGLIDVSLDAYGWSGPWKNRRGFDSLVQMSSGIADAGRLATGAQQPVPLPVQALDHATGYLLAASALTALVQRALDGMGSQWRTSLARMAELLISTGTPNANVEAFAAPKRPLPTELIEHTSWGDAHRLAPPLIVRGAPLQWALPARRLGSDPAQWWAP